MTPMSLKRRMDGFSGAFNPLWKLEQTRKCISVWIHLRNIVLNKNKKIEL